MLTGVNLSVLYIENQWVEHFELLLRLAQIGPLVPRQYTKSVSKQKGQETHRRNDSSVSNFAPLVPGLTSQIVLASRMSMEP